MYSAKIKNRIQVLPESYAPTEDIIFCGNNISNYQFLIEDNGFHPILIGRGEIPRIWLFAKSEYDEIIALIDDSVSVVNQIKVDIQNSKKRIEIKDIPSGTMVLKLEYNEVLKINEIDLRTIGYNIFGKESQLMVGDTTIIGNTFNNVKTIIGLNEAKKIIYEKD